MILAMIFVAFVMSTIGCLTSMEKATGPEDRFKHNIYSLLWLIVGLLGVILFNIVK